VRRRAFALAGLLAVGACISDRSGAGITGEFTDCQVPLDAIRAGGAIVLIRGSTFVPETVRVRPGGRVTWINCEQAVHEPHTSTADGGTWDSPLLPAGGWFSTVIPAAGEFRYFCRPHPFMRGVVLSG
jgi:plastocyanin